MKTLVILTALCFILTAVSFAGNVTITEVVTGGSLTLTMPSAFSLSGITIGGSSLQEATGNATYTVEDSRGTGDGWNLGFQIGQFQTGGTPNRTIGTDMTSMTILYADITCTYGQAKDADNGPKSLITSKTSVAGTQVKGLTAAAFYGMGKYTAQASHALGVGAAMYAGTYTATLTATLNAVP